MRALLLLLACTCQPKPAGEPAAPAPPMPERPTITTPPWVATGDVGSSEAIVWVHAHGLHRVRAEAWREDDPTRRVQWRSAMVQPATPPAAPTAHLRLTGLPPATAIRYRVLTGDGREAEGRLQTAPLPEEAAAVRLLVAGDLGGQGWCRPPEGYTVFETMRALRPDLALFSGDMIYADDSCPAEAPDGRPNVQLPAEHPVDVRTLDWTDPGALRAGLDRWWAYHRADPSLQAFLEEVPVLVGWDDHELINDVGPREVLPAGAAPRPGWTAGVELARRALLDWNPIDPQARPGPIHRRLRWGRHLEVFLLDNRSFRSPNDQPDGPDKTMLGLAQREWLLAGLRESRATWRVVASSVPLSIPTGSRAFERGRDGWASGEGDPTRPEGATDISATTGYEAELERIFEAIRKEGRPGVLFVTTDVHHGRILRYDNGDVPVHEIISGPLRAWAGEPGPLDPSFQPAELAAVAKTFHFTDLSIAADGALTVRLVDERGQELPGARLELAPPPESP